MPLPLVQGYLDGSDSPEHEKDQTHNKVIGNQGDACVRRATGRRVKQDRASWRPFPLPIKRGSDQAAPPPARVDGLGPQ